MHSRRFCALLLGIWLAGSGVIAWVAMHNLGSVDEQVEPKFLRPLEEVKELGKERVRGLFQYQAAEMNRYYADRWEVVQLILGALMGLMLLFSTNGNRVAMSAWAVMYLMVLMQHLAVTPRVLDLGRGLDFAEAGEMGDERRALGRLQVTYGWTEAVKGLGALVLGVRLVTSRNAVTSSSGRRRRRSVDLDEVNNADHSHIDG